MGVPNSASLANTPTTSYPNWNPVGIWLYGDIRKTMEGDVGNHDRNPSHTTPDTTILFSGSVPETRLSRLAGYNNVTPDRGQIVWNRNKLPARNSATQEVRMSDFQNFTTTVFKSSSISVVDSSFEDTKVNPSSSVFDFTAQGGEWRPPPYTTIGNLYNIAYIDNNDDPRLGILFVSSSNSNTTLQISQTGSRYDWNLYDWSTSSIAIDTNATIVCVDGGGFTPVVTSSLMGAFYWQNGTSTKMVPYEFTSASGASSSPGDLTIHSSYEVTPSTTYGAQILKASATKGYPEFAANGGQYSVTSLLVYNGFSSLKARLFSISGSIAQLGNNPGLEIFSGSEFDILNTSPGKKDKCYTSVSSPMGSLPEFDVMYGTSYNSAYDGDDTVRATNLLRSHSFNPNSEATFRNDPEKYLDIISNYDNILFTSSASQKYGAKSLIPLRGDVKFLAATAKSNGRIDVKYIKKSAQGYQISGSLTNVIGENDGFGLVQHQLPIGGVSLGTYTEYSASLASDPNSYGGSLVEYVAISYTAQAPTLPPGPQYPTTAIVKIYHQTGDIVYNSISNNVVNYNATYETVNNWSIPMLPQINGFRTQGGYQPLFSQEYLNTIDGNIAVLRTPYYVVPMIIHNNWAGGFRMSKNYLSIY